MKKSRFLSLLVCFTLLLQCFMLSGCGPSAPVETRVETTPAETQAVTTAARESFEAKADSAQSLLLYDVEKDAEVCFFDPDKPVSPGRFAQIVTALIVLENCELQDIVTVTSSAIADLPVIITKENLQPGEQLTVEDLTACAILSTAHDAARVLAEHVAGSQQDFVALMNERVLEMGCTDTVFTDASGLDTANARTTARDLVKIIKEAVKNDAFRTFWEMEQYNVPATDLFEERNLYSRNYMQGQAIIPGFYDERVTGGIQSYSADTGAHLVCTVEDGGSYIAVVLGARRTFKENGWAVISYGNYEEMVSLLQQGLTN